MAIGWPIIITTAMRPAELSFSFHPSLDADAWPELEPLPK
jgi:hypothetical protein